MVGDRGPDTATAASGDKKLGKITSTKMGSIYPTVTVGEIRGAVISATGYVFPAYIEIRAYINRNQKASWGHRVTLNAYDPDIGELRAAVRKLERIQQRMRKEENEAGEADSYAEYACRALIAAGVGNVRIAHDVAGRPRSENGYSTRALTYSQAVFDLIARLESIAVVLFGSRQEAA